MTVWVSFIGDLDDPDFHWDDPAGAPGIQNLPRRLVPSARGASLGADVSAVIRLGRKLDWGAWGVRMTGAELALLFGPGHPHAAEIAALEPDRAYGLVAAEAL